MCVFVSVYNIWESECRVHGVCGCVMHISSSWMHLCLQNKRPGPTATASCANARSAWRIFVQSQSLFERSQALSRCGFYAELIPGNPAKTRRVRVFPKRQMRAPILAGSQCFPFDSPIPPGRLSYFALYMFSSVSTQLWAQKSKAHMSSPKHDMTEGHGRRESAEGAWMAERGRRHHTTVCLGMPRRWYQVQNTAQSFKVSCQPRGMKMNMDYLCTPSCIHMSACIDVCQFVCLSVYLSCLSVFILYVCLDVCKWIYVFTYTWCVCVCICICICIYICLSMYKYVHIQFMCIHMHICL